MGLLLVGEFLQVRTCGLSWKGAPQAACSGQLGRGPAHTGPCQAVLSVSSERKCHGCLIFLTVKNFLLLPRWNAAETSPARALLSCLCLLQKRFLLHVRAVRCGKALMSCPPAASVLGCTNTTCHLLGVSSWWPFAAPSSLIKPPKLERVMQNWAWCHGHAPASAEWDDGFP